MFKLSYKVSSNTFITHSNYYDFQLARIQLIVASAHAIDTAAASSCMLCANTSQG